MNLLANPMQAGLIGVFVFVAGFATTALSIRDVQRAQAEWTREVAVGRFVYAVESSGSAHLGAARCEALAGQQGVEAAGSVIDDSPLEAVLSPGAGYSLRLVTPGLIKVMWPAVRSADSTVFAENVLARRLGLTAGSFTSFDFGSVSTKLVKVDQVLPSSARDDDSGKALVVLAVPSGVIKTCFVEAAPAQSEAVRSIIRAWFPPTTQPIVEPVWRSDSVGATAESRLDQRLALVMPWIDAAMLAAMCTLVVFGRRADLGLYRLLGLGFVDTLWMVAIDVSFVVYVPNVLGALGALGLTHGLSTPILRLVVVSADLKVASVLVALPLILVLPFRRQRIVALLKGV